MEENNNKEDCVVDYNYEQEASDRNTEYPLENIRVETIDNPVSQLDETTGVEEVDDPDYNFQSDMDQRYWKWLSQKRLRPRNIPKKLFNTRNPQEE